MKRLKKLKEKTQEALDSPAARITIGLISIICMITFLYWIGFKGVLGILTGMFFMSYLILSKNSMLMYFIKKANSETYIEEIQKKPDGDLQYSKEKIKKPKNLL